MDAFRIANLAAAALLAASFWRSASLVGGWLVRALRQGKTPASTTTAIGLAAYALAGVILGMVGLLWWPLLAVLALLPAVATLPVALRRACRRPRRTLSEILPDHREILLPVCLVAAVYAALATLPAFHYDLLTNYLGVAKEYLLARDVAPLEWNIFSSVSLPLHVLAAYLLALNSLLGEGPFTFGWGTVFGIFHLLCIGGSVQALREISRRLIPEATTAAALLAAALWLTMPQTLLLTALSNIEFVTTFFALAVVAGVAAAPPAAALTVGALCGFLVAAKAQYGVWALAAILALAYRARSLWPLATFAGGGAILLAPQMARNWLAFNSPFFPYLGGSQLWRLNADGWLASIGVQLPSDAAEFGRRILDLVTAQPETGITLAVLLLTLTRRVRLGVLWLFVLLPVLGISLASNATHHVLRWTQPALALALLAAGANAVELCSGKRTARWALAAVPLLSLGFALNFAGGLLGGPRQLLLRPADIVARQLPSLHSRIDLVARSSERVLYVGEVDAFYGAENGVLPAPYNGAILGRYLEGNTAGEAARSLAAAGFDLLAINPTPPASLAQSRDWPWADPGRHAAITSLLSQAQEIPIRGSLRVWRVPTVRESRPSPP